MSNTIWLGSGWTKKGKWGDFYTLCLDLNELAKNPDCIRKEDDKKTLWLTVGKRKDKGKGGQDLYIKWDNFERKETVKDSSDDMPF
tara:strand:- start:10 stop:267 length:258 start_codon:yes stop_codon:yes gene_type:complete